MYRHSQAAAVAAAVAARLRPAARLRAWPAAAAAGAHGGDPPRRRYRARPQERVGWAWLGAEGAWPRGSPAPPLPAPFSHCLQDLDPGRIGAGGRGGATAAVAPLLPPPRGPPRPPGARRCPPGAGAGAARALSPPEGLEGAITTVDGRREDDIAVRDRPPLPPAAAAAATLLLRPLPPARSAATGPGPARRSQPSMEEHLALVHAKLQHELPNFFQKIHDYGLYSPDVEFVNQPLRLRTRGRAMYQVALALCRAAAWGYFASVRLEVLALTQHPEDWSVRARWRLTGLPFHLCLLRFYRRDKRDLLRSYDAFSTFFLDSQGLIRCHHIDKLMPAPGAVAEAKKLLVAAAAGLAQAGPALQLVLEPPGAPGPPGPP
ncbi:uncharacterized protein C6orf136 homolog [Apteryx mantelli]|uniref:Uncharacterized protein C6orf136 homolog n=1 Tax=Apteryx mantelli TaxID=2696672 RepID=A0ABM4FXQ5_9AVES